KAAPALSPASSPQHDNPIGRDPFFIADLDGNGLMDLVAAQDGSTFFQWDTAAHGVGTVGYALSGDNVGTTYGYDGFARPRTTTTHVAGADYTVVRQLDGFGRLAGIPVPGGRLAAVLRQLHPRQHRRDRRRRRLGEPLNLERRAVERRRRYHGGGLRRRGAN